MDKDFAIRYTSVEIIDNKGIIYDIHNCYEFKGVTLTIDIANKLEIVFRKIDGQWVKESDPNEISFVFRGLKYLEFSKLFFIEQSLTVDELGYKEVEDIDYNWSMGENQFTGDQHMIFRFLYGEYIRVFADKIELVLPTS